MCGVAFEVAGSWEVEEELKALGGIGIKGDLACRRGAMSEKGHGSLRNLQKYVEFLHGAGGIGYHHLAAVGHTSDKLIGDKLVDPLTILDLVTVSVTEVALTDEERGVVFCYLCFLDFTVESNGVVGSGKDKPAAIDFRTALRRIEGEVKNGQSCLLYTSPSPRDS